MNTIEEAYAGLALQAAAEIERVVGHADNGWAAELRQLAENQSSLMRNDLHMMLKNAADGLAKRDDGLARRLRQQCQLLDGMPKRVGG
jgi:phosphate uptake regulator